MIESEFVGDVGRGQVCRRPVSIWFRLPFAGLLALALGDCSPYPGAEITQGSGGRLVIDVREAQSFPALARFVYGDAELGGLIAQLLKLELDAGIPVGTYTLPAKKELRRVAAEEEEVEAALRRAGEALDEGLPAKAAGFLETALALRPERADIRLRLGLAYLQAGNLEKAGPALQEAARLRPVDAEARYALGKYYRGAGDLALARQEFEAAISAGGESWSNPRASFDYAWLLGELGERQKARIAFRSFLHRYPGDPWAADAERELEELAEVPK